MIHATDCSEDGLLPDLDYEDVVLVSHPKLLCMVAPEKC